MRYLIIDNINDYSSNKSTERNKSDCIASMIESYINNIIGNEAELLDASENDFIFSSSKYNNFQVFIFRVNEDNLSSIFRINSSISQKVVFFFSVNENLDKYFPKVLNKFYFNFNEREKTNCNLIKINKLLDIDTDKKNNIDSIKKCSIDYANKSMNVTVGSGCNRTCSFCSISKTDVELYKLESVISEIKENLENGIKYFHINNHSFTSDLEYVEEFCNLIIKECEDIPYKWSCFIVPENVINNIDILSLLKKTKLDRIEIGVENINEDILSDFELNVQENQLINFIDACQTIGISSIAINYIIGSPNESEETLQKSKKFLELLNLKTFGKLDLNISFFYPDVETKYNNYQTFQERISVVSTCVKRKQSCLLNTNYLSKMDIYSWKWDLIKQINNDRIRVIYKLPPKERINIYNLSEYGIKTQIEKYFLSTSIPVLFDQKRLFDKRSARKIAFFFEEIENCIESYTPRLVSEHYVFVDDNNIMFIKPDQLFLADKNSPPINISEFDLYKSILSESSIMDILATNCKDFEEDELMKKSIINRLKELEDVHLIYYIQILN